ncbi:MAG: transposon-encoded TnpW family protein [Defluviitaleaceae bacterium]|nr:transposon-encoded TnpW family protein [Defluviitaleaceae bacterium]
MNIENTNITATPPTTPTIAPRADSQDYVKKIDKITCKVKVHFSTTNKETMQDKIIRMLWNEVGQM